jgi:FkbM family methyltransferase
MASTLKYWRFQGRAWLTRLGIWGAVERWRLRRRFHHGIAHEPDFRFFHRFQHDQRLFVDVGANLGQSALSFRLAHPTAPILSYEPNPDMALSLWTVRRLLGDSFDYRLYGLGSRTEVKPLYIPVVKGIPFPQCASFRRECLDNNPSMRALLYEWTHTDRFTIVERPIQLVRFDELGLNPGFVKIDVEGGEADVVAGMEATLARSRPLILTEGCGAQTLLVRHGYRPYLHEPAENRLRPACGDEGGANTFYVPEERVHELERLGAINARTLRLAG